MTEAESREEIHELDDPGQFGRGFRAATAILVRTVLGSWSPIRTVTRRCLGMLAGGKGRVREARLLAATGIRILRHYAALFGGTGTRFGGDRRPLPFSGLRADGIPHANGRPRGIPCFAAGFFVPVPRTSGCPLSF